MVVFTARGNRTSTAGGRIPNGHLPSRIMTYFTILKVLFATWVVANSAIEALGEIESSTVVATTYGETAPSLGVDATTAAILTELGVDLSPIIVATDESSTNLPVATTLPERHDETTQPSADYSKHTGVSSLSTGASSPSPSSPAQNVGNTTSIGEMSTDFGVPETATGMADLVTGTRYALPNPVIAPMSIHVTPQAVTMCLNKPVGAEGSVLYSLVARSQLDHMETRNSSHDMINGTVCLRKQDLNSGTPYSIQVLAHDDDVGISQSTVLNITTDLLQIDFALDPVLQLFEDNSTRVSIGWSFRNVTHVEKFIFSYNQSDNYPGGFKQHEPIVLAGPARHIILTGIFPGATYDLRLQGFSGPRRSTVLRRWIPETEPPSHLRAFNSTASTTTLIWTFPPHTPPQLVRHFRITYREVSSHAFTPQTTITTRTVISGLMPDTMYEIFVSTISINGHRSWPRNVTTMTGVAPPKIINYSATSTSFTVDWESPRKRYQHIVTCFGCPVRMQSFLPGVTRATFEGLLPGNEYNGTLQAVKDINAKSQPTLYTKLLYPEGPRSITVRRSESQATGLEVSWSPAICPGCLVDSYRTSVLISKTSQPVMSIHSSCLVGECKVTYKHLTPGEEYQVEVRAVRMGLYSNPPVVSQPIRIAPAVPADITFPEVSHNHILMAWRPSHGVVDEYVIGWCEVDARQQTAECNTYMSEVNSSITQFKCLGLKPDTNYNLTLSSSSGGIRSAVKWVVKSTTSHYPRADNRPPKAPGNAEVTPYTFPVTFDTSFFDNTNQGILYYTVLVAEASAVSHANLPDRGNLSEGLQTRTWATVIGQETIQRYQIADQYPYDELVSGSGKRDVYARRSIVIGEDKCSEEEKDVYCNGPLKHNKIYVYQFRAFTATGYADTPFSRNVILPEDNSGIVAGISVVLILLFVIVLILIGIIMGRKFRGNYGKYMAARSMEPLPVGVMTRVSTNKRFSRPVQLTDFCHDFQVMNAHCHYAFSREYESIMKIGRKMTSNAAVLAANVSKNRYTNILPFDRTRVMLSPIDDVEGSDYINANYIAGYDSPREYIACQGPLPGTVDDMWRMIWEQDVAIVVMLTQLIEKSTVKCDQYWEEDNSSFQHGDIQVTMTSTDEQEDWNIRDFTLVRNENTKKVRQFHYLAWPDHGVPDCSVTLLNFIRDVREQIPKKGNPTVVHCSAGVGRTGTFICLDRLIKHMEEFTYIDILSVVCDLRMHRSYMVQTEQQYVFIHRCVLDILEEKGIAPKRLPSISSMDSNDMISTRDGSNASAIKHLSETEDGDDSGVNDVVVFRQHSRDEDSQKRISMYSMGSPKKSLIENDAEDRSSFSSPKKKGSTNGSVRKLSNPFKPDMKEEYV